MRFVDRLAALELPAGQIHSPGPDNHDLPGVPIDGDRLISDRTEPERGNQAQFRSLTVARSADAPARAMLNLWRVYPEQPQPLRTAP